MSAAARPLTVNAEPENAPPLLVETPAALRELIARVSSRARVALDTEADSLHAYPEKLCLVQVSLRGEGVAPVDALIDPLAPALAEDAALTPLLETLRPRELLLHGADFDLRLLQRSLDFVPARVFDTMLAARLLGASRLGLKELLAERLGVAIGKGSRKANWARRPLDSRMIRYARDDTRYLDALAAQLRAELEARGRLSWHAEMCAALVEDCAQPREVEPDRVWRLKGSNRLNRLGLAVLRALWRWREDEAVRCNKPPYFIVSHELLVAAAAAVGAGRSPSFERVPTRRRDAMLEAVEGACALAPDERPSRLRARSGAPMSGEQQRRLANYKRRRDAVAESLGLDPWLVASKSALDRVARDPETGGASLMRWQRALLLDAP